MKKAASLIATITFNSKISGFMILKVNKNNLAVFEL